MDLETGPAAQGFARTLFARVLRLRYAPLRMASIGGVHWLHPFSADPSLHYIQGQDDSLRDATGSCTSERCAAWLALDMAVVAKL